MELVNAKTFKLVDALTSHLPEGFDEFTKFEYMMTTDCLLIMKVEEADVKSNFSRKSTFKGKKIIRKDMSERIVSTVEIKKLDDLVLHSQELLEAVMRYREGRRDQRKPIRNGMFLKRVINFAQSLLILRGQLLDFDLLHLIISDLSEDNLRMGQLSDKILTRKDMDVAGKLGSLFELKPVSKNGSYGDYIWLFGSRNLNKTVFFCIRLSKKKATPDHVHQNTLSVEARTTVTSWLNAPVNESSKSVDESSFMKRGNSLTPKDAELFNVQDNDKKDKFKVGEPEDDENHNLWEN